MSYSLSYSPFPDLWSYNLLKIPNVGLCLAFCSGGEVMASAAQGLPEQSGGTDRTRVVSRIIICT